MKLTLVALSLASLAFVVQAQTAAPAAATAPAAAPAASPAPAAEAKPAKPRTAQNNRMSKCSADFKATGKEGKERKAFMSDCLKG